MNEITVYIRYKNTKNDYSTTPNILLGDLIDQLIDRRILDPGNYVFYKGNETALVESMTLEENGICDGDVLDCAIPGKAG